MISRPQATPRPLLEEDLAASFRSEFGFLEQRTYLNTAAEGLSPASAQSALNSYVEAKCQGTDGRESMYATEQSCRRRAANLLGVEASEIAFLGSASRGLDAILQALDLRDGDNVVTADIEYPTTIYATHRFRERQVEARIVRSQNGIVSYDALEAAADRRTRLVIASLVSFWSGQRLDSLRLSEIARRNNAYLLLDVTQAFCAVPVAARHADFVISSSYKWALGAPGVALLFVNAERNDVVPQYTSWKSVVDVHASDKLETYHFWPDTRRFEEGMPNYPGLFVLDHTLGMIERIGVSRIASHVLQLSERLIAGLAALGVTALTPSRAAERAGIVSFLEPRFGEYGRRLRESGVLVWTKDGRVRISSHFYNSPDHIDRFLSALAESRRKLL